MGRKRLLVDVDEVLGDFQTPTFDIIHRLFGRKITHHDFDVWDCFSLLSEQERKDVFVEVSKPGFCTNIRPIPGAFEAIEQLRQFVDVYAVTSHFPQSATWVHERDEWLVNHFKFSRRSIVHTSAKYLVRGDAFLDDNPDHVRNWLNEYPEGLGMLWHIPNTRKLPHDDIRVRSWGEVSERVKSMLDQPSVYDLLDEREWAREGDPYPPGNYCQTCGATAPGSQIPTHKADCRLHIILTKHRQKAE